MLTSVAIVVLLVLAGGGVFGGIALITQPSGAALGLDESVLPSWYAGTFSPAGWLLLTVFGVFPLVTAVVLALRPRRGWIATALVGLALTAWMIVQIAMIGLILPPMQIAFLLVGVALTVLGGWRARVAGR